MSGAKQSTSVIRADLIRFLSEASTHYPQYDGFVFLTRKQIGRHLGLHTNDRHGRFRSVDYWLKRLIDEGVVETAENGQGYRLTR